jgi:hypothetical protein
MIVSEPKRSQIGQLPDRFWDRGNLIFNEEKLCQIRQLPDRFWDRGNLIFTLG